MNGTDGPDTGASEPGTWVFGPFRLDTARRELSRAGEPVALEPKPYALLELLLSRRGEVVAKDELIATIWAGRVVTDSVISRCVAKLRKALGEPDSAAIANVHGFGYRFDGDLDFESSSGARAIRPGGAEDAAESVTPPARDRPRRTTLVLGALAATLLLALLVDRWSLSQRERAVRSGISVDAAAAIAREPSVAVLPFANHSEDGEQSQYLVDGIHENVLTGLSRIHELRVISRTSVARFRGERDSIPAIADELGVHHVLEGSVQRIGKRVRVTVQLVDALTDHPIWGEVMDGEMADVFEMQTRIAERAAREIGATLTAGEQSALERAPTQRPDAWTAYLRARAQLRADGQGRASLFRAEALLKRAVTDDPDFALAWAVLSRVHTFTHWFNYDASESRIRQAREAADRALELDDRLPESHVAMGLYRAAGFRDYVGALEAYERALKLDPNAAETMHFIASAHRRRGNWDQAVAGMERALVLDPENVLLVRDLAGVYRGLRRYDRARPMYRRLLQLQPDDPFLRIDAAMLEVEADGNLEPLRRTLEAIPPDQDPGGMISYSRYHLATYAGEPEEAERWIRAYPRNWLPGRGGSVRVPVEAALANTLEDQGRIEEAQELDRIALQKVEVELSNAPNDASAEVLLASLHAGLGNREEALRRAQRALDLLPADGDALNHATTSFGVIEVYLRFGMHERILAQLEKVFASPWGPGTGLLRIHPMWEEMRQDPRFIALLDRVDARAEESVVAEAPLD